MRLSCLVFAALCLGACGDSGPPPSSQPAQPAAPNPTVEQRCVLPISWTITDPATNPTPVTVVLTDQRGEAFLFPARKSATLHLLVSEWNVDESAVTGSGNNIDLDWPLGFKAESTVRISYSTCQQHARLYVYASTRLGSTPYAGHAPATVGMKIPYDAGASPLTITVPLALVQ